MPPMSLNEHDRGTLVSPVHDAPSQLHLVESAVSPTVCSGRSEECMFSSRGAISVRYRGIFVSIMLSLVPSEHS
jgi:hypothetical protein